jgi:hypothetical protein
MRIMKTRISQDEAMSKAFEIPEELYPTPETTPLLAGTIRQPNDERNKDYAARFPP